MKYGKVPGRVAHLMETPWSAFCGGLFWQEDTFDEPAPGRICKRCVAREAVVRAARKAARS